MAKVLTPEKHLEVEVYPATAECWEDIEMLFGPKGAYAGCWCMFWRLNRADFKKLNGEGTKAALNDLTSRNEVAGLLAYIEGNPSAGQTLTGYSGYMGIASVFREAGFVKVGEASETQLIVRYSVES